MTSLKNKIRYLLGDISTEGKDIFTYESSNVFTISENNIVTVDTVFLDDVELGDSFWSYDTTKNKVTITQSLTSVNTIEIDYHYYPNYSSSELTGYIQAALVYISLNNYENFIYDYTVDAIYPEPTLREENLIAMITSIIINPNNKSISLPDVKLTLEYTALSLEEKISSVIATFKKDSHGYFEVLDF